MYKDEGEVMMKAFSKQCFKQGMIGLPVRWILAPMIALTTGVNANAAEYDYVIVGAGSGGGTLASSLARKQNPQTGRYNKVLLLEAGKELPDDEYYTSIPALNPIASERPGLAWKFMVEHYDDPDRANRDRKRCPGHPSCEPGDEGIFYPRGATVGGSSTVNATISVLPHNSDWDRLANTLSDSSWSARNMRQYLDRVEYNIYPLNMINNNHKQEGWMPISLPLQGVRIRNSSWLLDFLTIITDASRGLGMPPLPIVDLIQDTNDAVPADDGFYLVPGSIDRNGRRVSVRNRIRDTLKDGKYSLTLKTGALVTRVLFDDANGNPTKAIGVEYRVGNNLYEAAYGYSPDNRYSTQSVTVNNEVILSAGAFNTPQLLMLSGIGDAEQLSDPQINIPVRVDLPGVGKHLQDRYEVPVIFQREEVIRFGPNRMTQPKNFLAQNDCSFELNRPDDCFLEWNMFGTGVYAQGGAIVSTIRRSAAATTPDPDLFIFALGGTFEGYYPNYSSDAFSQKNQFTWAILKGHSSNEGYVRLRSSDPSHQPEINFNYFGGPAAHEGYEDLAPEHQADVDSIVEAVRVARTMRPNRSTLPREMFREVWPGTDIDSDEELRDFVMNEAWGHHACGTARMGTETHPSNSADGYGAVVDNRFRVHGTQNLRVVDASVWPEIPGFFIALPTLMLGEKAADVIAEDNI